MKNEPGIIYNVTIKVAEHIKTDWLHWLKEEHIPQVISTGCFTHALIVRLLETDESEGPTYAVQYFATSKTDYDRYVDQYATALRQKSFDKWGDRFLAFRTLMEVVK
ncbi:MAG: DUF4286 family protein [Ferruginibacter sp.]